MSMFAFLLAATALSWPRVQPVEREVYFSDARSAVYVLPIHDESGHEAYVLSCFGQEAEPSTDDFVYSGDFECRLREADQSRSTFSTLLTEDADQSRDWQSRARFFSAELYPPCGEIPEFGSVRSFRLRGMRITLVISEQRFDKDRSLSSFGLSVTVQPDLEAAAQGEIASPPQIDRHWADLPCTLTRSVAPQFQNEPPKEE